ARGRARGVRLHGADCRRRRDQDRPRKAGLPDALAGVRHRMVLGAAHRARRGRRGDPMIAWPAGAEPGGADIHVCDEIVADVAPERVWAWLVRAARWSELYDNCK